MTVKLNQQHIILLLIITVVFLFSHGLVFLFPGVFETANARVNDLLFHLRYSLREKEKVSPYIIHIVFNDASYRELDLAPWDRSVYGKLIAISKQAGITLLAYDVFFRDKSIPGNDELLIKATKETGIVYYPVILYPRDTTRETEEEADKIVEKTVWHPEVIKKGNPPAARWYQIPFKELSVQAKGLGHVNIDPDRDGINRRFPLLYQYGDGYIPSLIFRLMCDYLGVTDKGIEISFGRHIILKKATLPGNIIKDIHIPIDRKGRVIINYVAPWKDSFFEFPIKKMLKADADPEYLLDLYDKLEGSVAIISDISARNKDIGPGIFDKAYPYGGLHVNIANMILTQNFIRTINTGGIFFISLILGLFLWILAVRCWPILFFISSLVLYALFIVLNILLFISFKTLPQTMAPTIGFFLSITAVSVFNYIIEEKEKMAFRIQAEVKEKLTTTLREQLKEYTAEIDILKSRENQLNKKLLKLEIDKLNTKRDILQDTIEDLEIKNEKESVKVTRENLENPGDFSEIITNNTIMFSIFKTIEKISKTSKPILITGESGTGKELIAGAIHTSSGRKGKFVSVNVAGLDDTAFTDTLFGHKKGAYTGAVNHRDGLVATAEEGTLFLDEIGDLENQSQVKLLRLMQENEYYALGSDVLKKTKTRIIAATNADIEEKIKMGEFRKDMAFRFTHKIPVPPLRKRLDDIPLLVRHFLEKSAQSCKKEKPAAPKELETLLQTYHFPGNIRELENMIEEAVSRHESKKLSLAYFREYIRKSSSKSAGVKNKKTETEEKISYSGAFPTLDDVEIHFILEAIKKAKGNKKNAAQLLGITYFSLNRRLKKFQLE